jgi:two-component system response regulator HydG
MSGHAQFLVVVADDDPHVLRAMEHHLAGWGCRVATAPDKARLLQLLAREPPGLLLLDLRFGEHDGVELLQELQGTHPNLPVVLLTAHGSIDSAVSAIKLGAYDYLTKPPDLVRLQVIVRHVMEKQQLTQKVRRLEQQLTDRPSAPLVWGNSPAMRHVQELVDNVAPTDVTVLILGENGTGKELVARRIHQQSTRRLGPFVPVNMAALPRELIESTLFGHEKGAFTGAEQSQVGCCEAADKGTLFLDEIGEMDFAVQAKILRFLQDRGVQRVGSSRVKQVDVRVLAATNRDLTELIRQGQFREDLYYRLNVVPIVVPPLRERREDIPQLAAHFLERAVVKNRKGVQGFTPEAMQLLQNSSWPGNVRQLENLIERLVIFCRTGEIGADMIPPEIKNAPPLPVATRAAPAVPGLPAAAAPPSENGGGEELRLIDQMERQAIVEALAQTQGNVREAARLLGYGQATVYRKIKRYGIDTSGRGSAG